MKSRPGSEETVLRLCLDLNVLFAAQLAFDRNMRGSSASMLVTAVRDGVCPAGAVQFITSVPVLENWTNVLVRHFGFDPEAAEAKAWILQQYASEGPLNASPQLVVGSLYVPFASEEATRRAADAHLNPDHAGKLFDEITDDMHVLLAAIAGRADILATSNLDDFRRGPAIALERPDVILFPAGNKTIVIAKPSFVAFWLRQGVVPDYAFVLAHPDDFRLAPIADARPIP